ncbi:hypothetical protein M011DRAFT_480655 [Sporormia fimetaria CBS 119925]|uniref:Membrane insertase YidC/Oxa/ALB C-terminal domain-containing protein n=1 Tax=Sporormia fimetaria CBS 119925 TaxID=1340428 RepID=A0A6A6V2V6_9PLEO|nr:hypothetical protein M011DRAFT_480655 [Sporormia fimetaria CBS 119925]
MIPSRGLQPVLRFSSVRQRTVLSTRPVSSRNTFAPHASSVRYASWYAPWSWGRSSTPSTESTDFPAQHPAAEAVPEPTSATAMPEVAPTAAEAVSPVQHAAVNPSAPTSVEAIIDEVLVDGDAAASTLHAVEKVGDLKAMGLDYGWGPTAMFEWILEHVHLTTGYEWGASIVLSAVLIRFAMFKLQFNASDNAAKMTAVKPMLEGTNESMRKALMSGDQMELDRCKKEQRAIYKEIGIMPFKSFMPLIVQGGMGYGAFRCLRGMASLPVPGLEQSGFLWFPDLTISDPTNILPIATGGVMWLLFKLGGETGASNQNMGENVRLFMQHGMPIIFTCISLWQPGSIQLYLFVTTTLSGVTAGLLRSRKFRQSTGLTPLPTPEATALWTKVAKGDIPLDMVYKDGVFVNPEKIMAEKNMRLNVSGSLPQHLQAKKKALKDRDHDYDTPPAGFLKKLDWFQRNYKPAMVASRMKTLMANVKKAEDELKAQKTQGKVPKRTTTPVSQPKMVDWEARRRLRQK